ncbi:MAG: response regulator [Xanthomonadales bacterium]|jgi:two-component system chemotaxis response regulator CheY|nr:response regulator [Xanthomonadales bacterium]
MMGLFKKGQAPRKLRMIVVDDSNIIRGRIERSQHQALIEIVGSAENGLKAVALCEQLKPDLATMDITMPEMDGIECIRQLLKIKPDMLILVVSALNDQVMILEALKAGAHGFLSKPFNEASLNRSLSELIK